MIEHLAEGFFIIMHWENILAIILGLYTGCTIGALPGLSPSMAIALAAPFTFGLPPVPAISFLLGIYKGGVYGGSISAILLSTPGTPEAAATLLDGYPLSQQGRARHALDTALYASIFGDLVGTVVLVTAAPFVAHYALKIGPAEMVPMILLAMAIIISTLDTDKTKGFIAACLGGIIALMGIDPITGSTRFIFDNYELSDGVALIPFLVGLFAVPEVISVIVGAGKDRKNEKQTSNQIVVQGEDCLSDRSFPIGKPFCKVPLSDAVSGRCPALVPQQRRSPVTALPKKAPKSLRNSAKEALRGFLPAKPAITAPAARL